MFKHKSLFKRGIQNLAAFYLIFLAGEALVLFHDSGFTDLAKLMKYQVARIAMPSWKLLMDMSTVLIGAFLRGFAMQLDVPFYQSGEVLVTPTVYMVLCPSNTEKQKVRAVVFPVKHKRRHPGICHRQYTGPRHDRARDALHTAATRRSGNRDGCDWSGLTGPGPRLVQGLHL